jgi:HMG (high mobility group) box
MTISERRPWTEMASRDRARFELEKSMYTGPWKAPVNMKDPAAPRRPISVFLAFCKDHRDAVKKKYPGLSTNKISAILSKLWKASSPGTRDVYFHLDQLERDQYKREKEVHNKNLQNERQEREDFAMESLAVSALSAHVQDIDHDCLSLGEIDQLGVTDLQSTIWEPIPIPLISSSNVAEDDELPTLPTSWSTAASVIAPSFPVRPCFTVNAPSNAMFFPPAIAHARTSLVESLYFPCLPYSHGGGFIDRQSYEGPLLGHLACLGNIMDEVFNRK